MTDVTAIQKLLQSPETLATVVHAILRTKYGEESYDWDVTTMYLEVQDDFRVDMDAAVADRWAAMQIIMTTNAFFQRLDAFLAICNTLNTGRPYFEIVDPATMEEIAWAIAEVSLNRELLPFAPAIQNYVRTLAANDGYDDYDIPDILDDVFDDKVSTELRSRLRQLHTSENGNVVEAYIDDQLRDLVSQFDQIPSMADWDQRLLAEKGLHVDDLVAANGRRA